MSWLMTWAAGRRMSGAFPCPGPTSRGIFRRVTTALVTLRMLEGDVSSDCQVDIGDCEDIAFRYGLLSGHEGYSQWLDLQPAVPDGRIGLKDLQFACGRLGSTCQAPLPCDQSGLTCPTPEMAKGAATESNANVRVDPPSQNTVVGQQFTVDVAVDGVDNLGAYEFSLQFDPGKLTYVGVSNGSLLGSSGREVLYPDPIVDVDEDVGSVTFGCGTYPFGTPGASGSGQLAQVTFEAAGAGVSPLDLTMVDTMDPLAKESPPAARAAR